MVTASADDLVTDLERRISAITRSPSSQLPLDVYREAVDLIRARDSVGLREQIKVHGAGAIDWFREWRERVTQANLEWGYGRNWDLAEWQPRIDRFVAELGPEIEDLLAIGLALVEYRREDLPSLLQWLDRLQAERGDRQGASPPPVRGACADLASAVVLEMMAASLALRAWPSLETLMTWPYDGDDGPVLGVAGSFHHYQFFDTYAWTLPHTHRLLLERSEVWNEATHERTEPLDFILWWGSARDPSGSARRSVVARCRLVVQLGFATRTESSSSSA